MRYDAKSKAWKRLMNNFYFLFYFSTVVMIWMAHKKVVITGGNTFCSHLRKMTYKYRNTLRKLPVKDKENQLLSDDMMLFNAAQTASKPYRMN